MVNVSNSAQRKAASSGDCEKDFLSSSSSAEEFEQSVDVDVDVLLLLLAQDMRQSQYGRRFDDDRSGQQLYSQQGSGAYNFQSLSLD